MKSDLVRLGIRGFKPQLRKAPEQLRRRCARRRIRRSHRTRSMRCGAIMTRLALVREQIEAIEQARAGASGDRHRKTGPDAMVRTAGQHPRRRYRNGGHAGAGSALAKSARSPGGRLATPGSPVRRTKADPSDARKVSPNRAMPGSAAA